MSHPLVFVDTETTSLREDRSIWEVATIRVDPDGTEREWSAFVRLDDVDLAGADPYALQVGRFHQRHPQVADGDDDVMPYGEAEMAEWLKRREARGEVLPQHAVAERVERETRGAILIASNPTFDHVGLTWLLRRHNHCPTWHYRPLDVATLAAGYLLGRIALQGSLNDNAFATVQDAHDEADTTAAALEALALPWSSEKLAAACGVMPAHDDERHTALGDARWVRRCWELLMADYGA